MKPARLLKMSLPVLGLAMAMFQGLAFAEDLTLDQVQKDLHGGDLTRPSPDSLIGKYLAETGASTVVRKFANAPVGNEIPKYALSEDRLVVAVSENTFPVFKKYFSSMNMMYQVYEPNDMKLTVGFEGKRGTEGMNRDDMTFTVSGTLMIPILLDSQEGARARNFFKLADKNSRYAANPWFLRSANNEPYSAMSAFMGCTHWFGGMPIGNNTVDAFNFPHGDEDPTGDKPNTKKLVDYVVPEAFSPEMKQLIRDVWTVPGHQQLGEILAPSSFRRGEFANPGWVAYTLTGTVKTDRIPVIFLLVDDEKAPLPADFKVQISAI